MTQKHTPEPWRLYRNNQSVGDAVGNAVCDVWPRCDAQLASEEGKANARRIVACVNACAGVINGELAMTTMSVVLARMNEAEQQRDDLQAEVDELLDLLQSLENDAAQIPQFMWTKIQRVVKKHTGATK